MTNHRELDPSQRLLGKQILKLANENGGAEQVWRAAKISQSSFYDYCSGVREWPPGKFEIIVEALGKSIADVTRLAGIVAESVEIHDLRTNFAGQMLESLRTCTNTMRGTHLSKPIPIPPNIKQEFTNALATRLEQNTIQIERVESFLSVHRFQAVLTDVLRWGTRIKYSYIRQQTPGARYLPVLNMFGFDNRTFIVGGYFFDVPDEGDLFMVLEGEKFSRFYGAYWNRLWTEATALNAIGDIDNDLPYFRQAATDLQLSDAQFADIVDQAREEAKQNPIAVSAQ